MWHCWNLVDVETGLLHHYVLPSGHRKYMRRDGMLSKVVAAGHVRCVNRKVAVLTHGRHEQVCWCHHVVAL